MITRFSEKVVNLSTDWVTFCPSEFYQVRAALKCFIIAPSYSLLKAPFSNMSSGFSGRHIKHFAECFVIHSPRPQGGGAAASSNRHTREMELCDKSVCSLLCKCSCGVATHTWGLLSEPLPAVIREREVDTLDK